MNTLMMVVVVLIVLCYFGGKYCPSVLKKNKELLLGVAGGLVLCSFFGLRLEGMGLEEGSAQPPQSSPPRSGRATPPSPGPAPSPSPGPAPSP